jgi:hypothetical protein
MRFSLRNFVTPSIPLSVFMFIVIALIWLLPLFAGFTHSVDLHPTFLGNIILPSLTNDILPWGISFVFVILNAFIILRIDNNFNITRKKTALPFYIYFFLLSCWASVYAAPLTHVSTTFYLLSVYILMTMYHDQTAVEAAFLSGLLFSCASLFIYEILLLIPFLWILFYLLKSISLKIILASAFGLSTPWMILFSLVYLLQDVDGVNNLLASIYELKFDFVLIGTPLLVYAAAMFLIAGILIFGVSADFRNNSIQNRKYLSSQILLFFLLVAVMIFVPESLFVLMPVVSVHICFLASYSFVTHLTKFYAIIFMLFLVVNFFLLLYSYLPTIQ